MYNTVEAMKAGAFDYVAKPFNIDEIEKLVKSALRVPLLTSESKGLKKVKVADDLLTGQSKVMRDLYKAIGRVAATDLTVLIQGESGTGKELIARSIHQHSLRADKSFVAINCAAIPSELMESELFGHEKGAFTGATERKRGKLEFASQGTLFLDEIGDMPMRLQSKLLRVLQEKPICV
jgi:two-component system nitrogen regulation response regulator GlnG